MDYHNDRHLADRRAADFPTAQLTALTANINRRTGTEPYKATDFMPTEAGRSGSGGAASGHGAAAAKALAAAGFCVFVPAGGE